MNYLCDYYTSRLFCPENRSHIRTNETIYISNRAIFTSSRIETSGKSC